MLGGGFLPLIDQTYCKGGASFGEIDAYTLDVGISLMQLLVLTKGGFDV